MTRKKSKSVSGEIKKNYRKHAAVITAAIGETLLKSWSIIIFCIKIGLDVNTSLFFLLMSLTPYLSIIVNAVFKGETKDVEVENKILKAKESSRESQESLFYTQMRDYAEVCCQLAARDGKVPEAIHYTNTWRAAQNNIHSDISKTVIPEEEIIPEKENANLQEMREDEGQIHPT